MDNYESFISMDLSKYVGKWVAIDKGKVIVADKDIKVVYDKAKSINPSKTPFITRAIKPKLRLL